MTFLVANVGPGAISPFDSPTQKLSTPAKLPISAKTVKLSKSAKTAKSAKNCKNAKNCQKPKKCQTTPNCHFCQKAQYFQGMTPDVTRIPHGQELQMEPKCCVWFQPAQEGPGGLPWLPQVPSVFSSQLRAQDPCPAFSSLPRAQGLDQLSSQPRDGAMRSGTLRDCFQGNPCVFWPRNGQKAPGLKRTVPATSRAQEGPSGLPWLPRKLSKTPQDFGPLRGSEKCFYGHFMFCIFSIGTALDIYFVYIWETCAYFMKVGTGSVAILDFKMEVCLHPVHHIGILFSYYFTIFIPTWYWEFQSKLASA